MESSQARPGCLAAAITDACAPPSSPWPFNFPEASPCCAKTSQEIVRAIKEPSGLPYTILVTNARLFTEEKYLDLRRLGVNQFSISMDFPDERHDDFRRSPGPVQPSVGLGSPDSAVTATATWFSTRRSPARTCRRSAPNYEKANEWGVQISYSAYTPLRTGSMDHYISSPEDLDLLRRTLDELLELQAKNGRITNSPWTLSGIYDFFKNGSMPGCQAGRRFLVVKPDGGMRPCSMFEPTYRSQKEILEKFVARNNCGGCYVSIRAYLDASFWTLLKDNVRTRVLARNGHAQTC